MITKDKEFEIIDKYNNGMSINQIVKEYGLSWHKIEKMLLNNNVQLRRRYRINEHYFDEINTPNKAYILGLLYADGGNTSNYDKNRYCVTITLKHDDCKILENIRDEIGYDAPIKFREYDSTGKIATLDICNKHMVLTLHNLGIIPNKTFSLRFPEWLDEELYSHFIRGYMDGDGCITFRDRKVAPQLSCTITSTLDMCTNISLIINNMCNIKSHIYNVGHTKCNSRIKTLIISGNLQCKRFLDYIYQDANFKLERKYKRYIDWYNNN